MPVTDEAIRQCLLQLVSDRGPTKTICPSEVARALDDDHWRELMPNVRAMGHRLAKAGIITITQKGHVVDPDQARGPIRYRLRSPKIAREDR